jgi:hypothetical protein
LQLGKAASLAKSGDFALSTRIAEEVVHTTQVTGPAAAPIFYDAACVFSLASAQAKSNPEQVRQFAARALELLRQACARGFKDIKHIKKDSDLDALRQGGDFKTFVSELEAELEAK